ncbi:MAG: glutamate--tRNA ligase [Campylobacterota bacterium]|nr:glutamate--tRNA ligase [Campylobacterota bacterium]
MLRFAPSPTGDMHIEDLRIAIVSYLIAQQRNESFTIRIEDTDKARVIEGKDSEIMQILEKFALKHENVFHQSEHLHMHQTLAIRLLEEGKAFICTCTDEEQQEDDQIDKKNHLYSGKCFDNDKEDLSTLKERGIPFVIRIRKPQDEIIYHDLIQGDIHTMPDTIDSFIILGADGTPNYNFASACDDMLSGINCIVRKEEYLCNTVKQKHIQMLLGYESDIDYAHLPVILTIESKHDTIKWMFEEGFLPDAIINYLLLLGNDKLPKQIFTLPEAIEWFDIENISKSAVTFDSDTLRFINRKHVELMDDKSVSKLFGFADADIGKLAKLYLEEASTIKELKSKIDPIFAPKDFECRWGEQMKILETLILNADMIEHFDTFKTFMMNESGLKGENFLKPLRILLTGAEQGPDLCDIYPLIKPYLLEIAS